MKSKIVCLTLNNRITKFTFCPYICGIFYGVFFSGFAVSIVEWLIRRYYYNLDLGFYPPVIKWELPLSVNIFLIFSIIFLCLFTATVFFNVYVFKRTKKSVINIVSEIIIPIILFLPCFMVGNVTIALINSVF